MHHMHNAATTLGLLGMVALDVSKHAQVAEVKQAKPAFCVVTIIITTFTITIAIDTVTVMTIIATIVIAITTKIVVIIVLFLVVLMITATITTIKKIRWGVKPTCRLLLRECCLHEGSPRTSLPHCQLTSQIHSALFAIRKQGLCTSFVYPQRPAYGICCGHV